MADAGSFNADLGINMQFNIDSAGLTEVTKTIKEISKGKDLQRYWKDVETATNNAAKAMDRYSRNVDSKGLAENFIKQINALKALTKNENLSELFPNSELNIDGLLESAKKIVPKINAEFSVANFSQAFNTFDLLKEKALDLKEVFSMLSNYADLVSRNSELSRENSQFRELIGDSDVSEVKSKLSEIKKLRDEAENIFESFLKVNNVERTDYWGDEKFSEYFNAIRDGSLTATEAITRFKTEYAYLLEEGFKTNNDTFGLEQLQAFSNKLDSIFRQVEETSNKINDIISNGVLTKSVENLSVDSSLTDSQRSLFGNLLKDEESLKSITALFQKLIEESDKTKNNELFNSEQLQQVLFIFDRIENSLSSLRSVISDVGDGEEFSPLLKMINNVQSSISELSTSVKGIGLNMNIDVGSDSEMEAKVQSKIANALQAYQRLFERIKMSGAGGSVINTNFFEFDINQYDTMMSKIQAYKKFIDNMRTEAKAQYNGKDVLYQSVDKSYWTQASAAMGQVTKAFNEMNAVSDTNPLKDLFGSGDLSEVVSQLGLIVAKLEEISTTASSFKEVFTNGFNVTASVEEIDKLTNRIKELEDELSKVKLNPVGIDKSNISSENNSVIEQQNKLQDELKETQKQAEETANAILKVTGYRGTNGGDPVTSNKSGATFWDSKKNIASLYGTNSSDKTLWSSELSFKNPLTIDAKNQKYGDITYLGDGIDETSKKIIELTNREKELRTSLQNSTESGQEQVNMALELQKVVKEISDISKDMSNPYGTHSTDWFAEYAKQNGYDGVYLKNVLDTPDSYAKDNTEVSDVFITFQREQLENTTLLAKANKELAESEREVALAELGVVKNADSPIKDVFQGGTASAEKLEEEITNIDSATEKASESAKEYRKILSQVGEFDIDSKVSAMYKRNDGQLESWTWRAKRDDEGNVLYDQNGKIDYDEPSITVISKYEQLEKIIVKADNELRNLQKDLSEIKAYDPTASTTNIEAKISDQKEYIRLLEQTVKVISQSDEYLLDEQQIIEARNKAAREYALTTGAKQEKTDAKQSASDEKKRLANIEQVNRALNKQQITIDAIEKTYNKTSNPDLDREVSNQQDLVELAQKKLAIQTKINSLQGKERNSANEKEFLELEKLIAEYKELAKYKLKANNPSKQELGGQNLQTLIQVQISNYDKLITKAKKYGDSASDTVEKLKEQRDILSKMGSDGKYSATADQYYASRDTYKVESAALSAFEAETKVIQDYIDAGTKFKSQFDNLSIKPDGDHQFLSWTNDLKELNAKIDEYNSKVKYLKENNIVDGKQVDEVKKLRDEIEETINVMTKTPQAKRGWTDIGASKAAEKVANVLKQNTKMSKEAKDAIRAYYNELRSGNPSQPIDEILVKVNQLVQKERELGRVGKSFGEIFKEKVIYGGAAQLAGMVGFYDVINVGREGFQTIKEYDNALTEMNKVSQESIETLKDFQKESFGLSDAIGTTASQIQNSTADFLRLGESFEQAKQSAQDANALFKVAEFDNIDEATEALVAMSQAYKELDKSQINDVLNYTGNNFSISTSELASALQRSAATLKVAGNDIYEATALVTAGNAVLQDAETVGSGLKMISLRLLGTEEAKNELASLGEDVDDFVVQTQSKIDETVRSYTAVASNAFKGISVLDENGNYRSTYEILRDISLVYQEILEADKKAGTNRGQALLEVLAGKNRSNVAASILQSPELLTSVYEEAMNNSQGSVAKELESQLQSIETHLNQLKNAWDKLWVNENNREVINFFLDLAKGILEVVDDIGVLNTAFIGIGAGLGIKNIGKTYKCTDFKIIC